MDTPWMGALVLAVAMVAARPGLVHAQDDVVEVASGDRITGDVRRLERGRLAFRTRAGSAPGSQRWAGTISIVWTEVVSLTSTQRLDVGLASGEHQSGTISSPAPGQLVVQTASGPTMPIQMRDVVSIVPIELGFRARTTGSLDFGLNVTGGGDARTYTLNGQAQHTSPGHKYHTTLRLASWLSGREGAGTLTRNDLALDVRRRLPSRWFALAHGHVQQDELLELDLRVLAGAGVGRRLAVSNRTRFAALGGLVWNAENYASADTDHSGEVVGGLLWDWFEAGGAMTAAASATTFISLARQRVRLELDASVRRDVFGNLYWALNVFESFDGDPPNDRPRSDLGVSLGLGWAF